MLPYQMMLHRNGIIIHYTAARITNIRVRTTIRSLNSNSIISKTFPMPTVTSMCWLDMGIITIWERLITIPNFTHQAIPFPVLHLYIHPSINENTLISYFGRLNLYIQQQVHINCFYPHRRFFPFCAGRSLGCVSCCSGCLENK